MTAAAEAPLVTLVVLAWNSWHLTRHCLDTLLASDLAGAEVLVVDNGSTDATPAELEKVAGIRVLRLDDNLGFVRGNNAGIRAADPRSDVVLLNNDLQFEQKDWLQRLCRTAHSDPDIGVVGCRLRLPDGGFLHAGTFLMPDSCWGQQIGSNQRDIGQYPGLRDVDGIVFACAYLRRETLERVGLLAEDFESYFEDTDYCWRAQRAGMRVVVAGDVTLIHDEHGSTRDGADESGHLPLFDQSRATFRRKWRRELRTYYRQELSWQSIMGFPSGYARSTRDLLEALDRRRVRVSYRYLYGPGTPFPHIEPEESESFVLATIRERKHPRRPDLGVVFGQGDVFYRARGRVRVGYTMLEVDGFPDDWVRQANKLDEIWVPSEANRQAFLDCGLERPIHVMPLGVDVNYFHPGVEAYPDPGGDFVFFSNFEWGERKEPWLLLQAFADTFRREEPVRLVCKVINRDPMISVGQEVEDLQLPAGGGRITFLYNVVFPHYQLGSLYRSMDCFVTTTRGEGWDMPLMEALACGLPAIATDWGAHQEFFHEGVGYPLGVRRLAPAIAKCPYYEGFSWADPDPEHLRYLLRHVYEHKEEARARGLAAAREMAQRWTWDQAAARIVERVRELG